MKLLFIIQLLLAAGVIYILVQSDTEPLNSANSHTFKLSSNPKSQSHVQTEKIPKDPQAESKTQEPKEPVHLDQNKDKEPTPPKEPEPTQPTEEPESSGTSNPHPSVESEEGPLETEITWIYKTQGKHDNLCQEKNRRPIMLCELGITKWCKRTYISEALANWWMICPIYTANTEQTSNLYELHKNFRSYARSYGINFQTVETIFPGQVFQLTEPNNKPHDLQYQADWIFAMRENLVNVGAKNLPEDWEFMSWIDQHIFWLDPYWFEKCIWLFSHYNIVHMLESNDFWSVKNTTDYHLEGIGKLYSIHGMGFARIDPIQYGLAFGMRREVFEKLGGLLDICIGTKCDLYQNYAYVGSRYTSQASGTEYISMLAAWQDHAIKVYNKSFGYLDSKVIHFRHCLDGCKTSEYHLHVQALMSFGYNPKTDLHRDEEGRLTLVNNVPLAKRLWELYGGAPRKLRRV